jgi:exosortase family protein XrtF
MSFKEYFYTLFKSKIGLFFLLAGSAYLFWFFLYELYIKPNTLLDEKVISNIIYFSDKLLSLFYPRMYTSVDDRNMQMIGVDGGQPVWVGGPCDGVSIMAIFIIFIACFPANNKSKLWFIPLGIFIIHFLNILRVSALVMLSFHAPDYLAFNHTYTFTILIYAIIFGMWMFWVNKFATKQ